MSVRMLLVGLLLSYATIQARQSARESICRSSEDCKLGNCVQGRCVCTVLTGSHEASGTCRAVANDWCLPPLSQIRGKRAHLLFDLSRAAEASRKSKAAKWLASVFGAAPRSALPRQMGHYTLHRGNTLGLAMMAGATGATMGTAELSALPEQDLPARMNLSSCAVVGSSRGLLQRRDGAEIDRHGAVIRFNQAPTKGVEEHAGSRTTLRLQNSHAAGFAEAPNREVCLVRLSSSVKKNRKGASLGLLGDGGCAIVQLSPQFEAYRRMLWSKLAPPPSGSKWSSGFVGIALAANLCARVTLYGFDFGAEYYYKKDFRKKGGIAEGHPWELERRCTETLAQLPGAKWRRVQQQQQP